jgi:hypothetical protein
MTHMRYWALSLAVWIGGAFIAIGRFAFAPTDAVWIAFAVAIAAAALSLAATVVALLRENHAFSGLSAVSALVAASTIIATRAFTTPTALWLAFAGGAALLMVSLRALALHETTVERVVHLLELSDSGESTAGIQRRGVEISGTRRAWLQWLGHTGVALAGAFVVASTFVWPHATPEVSPRWLAFGIGAVAASIGLGLLVYGFIDSQRNDLTFPRAVEILLSAATTAVAGTLVVLTALQGVSNLRWWTFGLGAGLVGVSLVASIFHELSSERVRHELELAHAPAGELAPFSAVRDGMVCLCGPREFDL